MVTIGYCPRHTVRVRRDHLVRRPPAEDRVQHDVGAHRAELLQQPRVGLLQPRASLSLCADLNLNALKDTYGYSFFLGCLD